MQCGADLDSWARSMDTDESDSTSKEANGGRHSE